MVALAAVGVAVRNAWLLGDTGPQWQSPRSVEAVFDPPE
jgi:hypothetical protein